MEKRRKERRKSVLVAVLKDQRDLDLLLREHWYRIPIAHLPKRAFTHLAFYQPAAFGKEGKCITHYARVNGREERQRIELLPNEPKHPRANDRYWKFTFDKIVTLKKPIKNIIPRRISFGFTDLQSLRRAHDILELYHVPKTEQLVAQALRSRGIETQPERTVIDPTSKRRVRLDLAISCTRGRIAIECDNHKAHASPTQQKRDRAKDAMLKRLGWQVIRLTEDEVLQDLEAVISRIQAAGRIRLSEN